MRTHVTVIAWMNIVLSCLVLLGGLAFLLLFGGIGTFAATSGGTDGASALPVLAGFGGLAFFVMAAIAIPGLILGWGLLNYAPWARIMGIVMAILHLLSIHTMGLSTLLGISCW